MKASPTYSVIDLFAGCGGLTAGLASTGRFRPVAAVESDPSAAATYALNFGEDHVFPGLIEDWLEGQLPSADVVVGGPPCQGFSALGKQDAADPRNELWRRYVDTIVRIRPSVFLIENVPQFLKSGQFESLDRQTRRGGRLSEYSLEPHLLNSFHYGAPQARRRAVLIGRRKGTAALGKPAEALRRSVVRDAFADAPPVVRRVSLPESLVEVLGSTFPGPFKTRELHVTRNPTDRSRLRYRSIPSGGNRNDLPPELSTASWLRHTSGSGDVMGRMHWDRPSVTIRTEFFKPEKGRYLHPDQHRPITHYEAALLQGFPEDFQWAGSKAEIARQIGNAVPVALGRALGDLLATHLDQTKAA